MQDGERGKPSRIEDAGGSNKTAKDSIVLSETTSAPIGRRDASEDDTKACLHDDLVGNHQGYSPLVDYDDENDGEVHAMMIFSTGPVYESSGSDRDGESNGACGRSGGGGGVFFADVSALLADARMGVQIDEEEGGDSLLDEVEEIVGNDEVTQEGLGASVDRGDFDFRTIADRALAALDREYHQTFRPKCDRQILEEHQEHRPYYEICGSETAETGATPVESSFSMEVAWNVSNTSTSSEVEDSDPPASSAVSFPCEQLFVANFDDEARIFVDSREQTSTEEKPSEQPYRPAERPLPTVNLDAVQQAVQKIRGKRPDFDAQLPEWEAQHYQTWGFVLATTPLRHAIIPSGPLSAFRKASSNPSTSCSRYPKATAATARLSRSATIAEALARLDLLQSQDLFTIHVIGCDGIECGSQGRIQELFGPMAAWIGAYAEAPRRLEMVLVGPNVPPQSMTATTPMRLVRPALQCRLESAEIRCYAGLYHEYISKTKEDGTNESWQSNKPNMIVAFQAGIWGYSEWEPTLAHLANESSGVPVVVTSYTIQEAEDDAEAAERVLAKKWSGDDPSRVDAARAWPPEWNPYASRVPRETATAPPGRVYRENAAWSCWRI
jgi:hypothetical protein